LCFFGGVGLMASVLRLTGFPGWVVFFRQPREWVCRVCAGRAVRRGGRRRGWVGGGDLDLPWRGLWGLGGGLPAARGCGGGVALISWIVG